MKSITNLLMVFLAGSLFFACGGGVEGDKAPTAAPETVGTVEGGELYVMEEGSMVVWEGSKPTGRHDGNIKISAGNLTMKDGAVVAGSFVMDMNTIVTTDLNGGQKAKLEDHLKSKDFFAVEKYATAKFEVTGSEQLPNDNTATHLVKGNLTMKDQTKNVQFKAIVSLKNGQLLATTPKFTIDRTEWNVQYGSKKVFDNLKDKFIDDNIGLSIVLKGKKQ